MSYDIVVVGGGPAGLSAAVQARQLGREVLVVCNDLRENPLYKAETVSNYLGLEHISGGALLERCAAHAMARGAELRNGRVLNILPAGGKVLLNLGAEGVEAGAVILATGVARGRRYPGEEEFLGRGVSYCAVCDGMLFRNRDVVVVGKAHDAPEEANFLASLGCSVTYVSGRAPTGLRDSITAVLANGLEILGNEQGVTTLVADGQAIPCAAVFLLRETIAPTDLVPGLTLAGGYIAVDRACRTNLPGIFAAGDCTGTPLQISKAVGEGLIAAQSAAEYLKTGGI